jgi:molybdate transport system substrate-binding protein
MRRVSPGWSHLLGDGLVITALGLACSGALKSVAADDLLLFAAASLTDAVEELGHSFEEQTGQTLRISVGSTANLARQIRAGAPADVFFSADERQMERLRAAGAVRPEAIVPVLSNALVVIVPTSAAQTLTSPEELLGFPRIALADPETVPAGVYAREYLETRGLWAALASRVVPTLDVRGALAAVEAEHAPAAIVYSTDAALSRRVHVAYAVPPEETPSIVYVLAPLRGGHSSSRALVEHLVSRRALDVYERFGFVRLRH